MYVDVHTPGAVQECKIFHNGVEMPHCFAADDTEGYAERYMATPDGKYIVADLDTHEPTIVTVWGNIEIRCSDAYRAFIEAYRSERQHRPLIEKYLRGGSRD